MTYTVTAEDPALVLSGGDHTFEGETFVGGLSQAVVLVTGGRARFRRCLFEGGINRALVAQGAEIELEDCVFVGNRAPLWLTDAAVARVSGVRFDGPGSIGLCVQRDARAEIVDCTFARYRDATALVRSGAAPVFRRCSLRPGGTGWLYEAGGRGQIVDCDIDGGVVGVHIGAGAHVDVRDLRVRGTASTAIAADGGGHVEDLVSTDALIGASLGPGATVQVVGGAITGGLIGVYLRAGARGAVRGVRITTAPAIVRVAGATTEVACEVPITDVPA